MSMPTENVSTEKKQSEKEDPGFIGLMGANWTDAKNYSKRRINIWRHIRPATHSLINWASAYVVLQLITIGCMVALCTHLPQEPRRLFIGFGGILVGSCCTLGLLLYTIVKLLYLLNDLAEARRTYPMPPSAYRSLLSKDDHTDEPANKASTYDVMATTSPQNASPIRVPIDEV